MFLKKISCLFLSVVLAFAMVGCEPEKKAVEEKAEEMTEEAETMVDSMMTEGEESMEMEDTDEEGAQDEM